MDQFKENNRNSGLWSSSTKLKVRKKRKKSETCFFEPAPLVVYGVALGDSKEEEIITSHRREPKRRRPVPKPRSRACSPVQEGFGARENPSAISKGRRRDGTSRHVRFRHSERASLSGLARCAAYEGARLSKRDAPSWRIYQ